MSYYLAKTLSIPFAGAVARVTEALAAKGFGILTTIDLQATMKAKLGVDLRPYTILGACNPQFAYRALQSENKIGTMLPCNVIIQEGADGAVEVAAVDPVASMQAIDNPALASAAGEVRTLLAQVVDSL